MGNCVSGFFICFLFGLLGVGLFVWLPIFCLLCLLLLLQFSLLSFSFFMLADCNYLLRAAVDRKEQRLQQSVFSPHNPQASLFLKIQLNMDRAHALRVAVVLQLCCRSLAFWSVVAVLTFVNFLWFLSIVFLAEYSYRCCDTSSEVFGIG